MASHGETKRATNPNRGNESVPAERVGQLQSTSKLNSEATKTKAASLKSSAIRESFGRDARLRSKTDFSDLFDRGKVVVDQVLVMHGRVAQARGRIGISVSKRVGNSPTRNRWKRLIRESYRKLAARSPKVLTLDVVVRPRRGALPTYHSIERSLTSLVDRLHRQLNAKER